MPTEYTPTWSTVVNRSTILDYCTNSAQNAPKLAIGLGGAERDQKDGEDGKNHAPTFSHHTWNPGRKPAGKDGEVGHYNCMSRPCTYRYNVASHYALPLYLLQYLSDHSDATASKTWVPDITCSHLLMFRWGYGGSECFVTASLASCCCSVAARVNAVFWCRLILRLLYRQSIGYWYIPVSIFTNFTARCTMWLRGCVCLQNISKSYERISIKYLWRGGTPLKFGWNRFWWQMAIRILP